MIASLIHLGATRKSRNTINRYELRLPELLGRATLPVDTSSNDRLTVMIRRVVLLLAVTALAVCSQAQGQAPRDSVSVGILNLLVHARSSVTVSGQIHHLGQPDGQQDPITVTIDSGIASALLSETNADGSVTKSFVYDGVRTYEDARPIDHVATSYLLFPLFDLADELANPQVSVDGGRTSAGQVAIHVHTVPFNGIPGDVDKTYVVDTTLHQIVAVRDTIKDGPYSFTHELRYGAYQPLLGTIPVPTSVGEYINGEQRWQLTVLSIQ